jgi:hypothetical protein
VAPENSLTGIAMLARRPSSGVPQSRLGVTVSSNTLTQRPPVRGLAAIQSPRNPNGLSHCIFECLIVEASSQAQNHLSVLADRYTERCRGVFDCTRDG